MGRLVSILYRKNQIYVNLVLSLLFLFFILYLKLVDKSTIF